MHDIDDHLPECPALGLLEDDMTGAYFYIDDEEGIFYVTCICERLRKVADRIMSLKYTEVTGWSDMMRGMAYAAGVRAAIDVVRDRERNLLDCHKNDDCHDKARVVATIADDIEYVLFKMVDPLSFTPEINSSNTNNGDD